MMEQFKNKIFRDPIYGYISIREDFCKDFIDTSIFQRLRRIEQTSMRVLYPTAHHDRFAHSIGVFHLGQIAFSNMEINSKDKFPSITKERWESYRLSFEIACLLHDCGHSPLSHTFEHYYLQNSEEEIKRRISGFYSDEKSFGDDYDNSSPAAHEKISALLLLEEFSSIIRGYGACPKLSARMIMGCGYYTPSNFQQKFENKLIALLNGSGIDVDSLDYIQRDSWASGVSNVEIDYKRLLSSLVFINEDDSNVKIAFKKSALSVLDNITLGRNFLYKWIYSHHIVNYEQRLITDIVNKIDSDSGNKLKDSLFSIESFKRQTSFNGIKYFLPSDDDLMYTIKYFKGTDPKIDEFLSRQYKYKAIWKTYFEFSEAHFNTISSNNKMKISAKLRTKILHDKYGEDSTLCIDAKPKLKGVNPNDFFIIIEDKLIDASKATISTNHNLNYFILYVTPNLINRKSEIISDIINLQS